MKGFKTWRHIDGINSTCIYIYTVCSCTLLHCLHSYCFLPLPAQIAISSGKGKCLWLWISPNTSYTRMISCFTPIVRKDALCYEQSSDMMDALFLFFFLISRQEIFHFHKESFQICKVFRHEVVHKEVMNGITAGFTLRRQKSHVVRGFFGGETGGFTVTCLRYLAPFQPKTVDDKFPTVAEIVSSDVRVWAHVKSTNSSN